MSDDLERKLEQSLVALGVTPAPDPFDWRNYYSPYPASIEEAFSDAGRALVRLPGRQPDNERARELGLRIIDGGAT